ncbi:type III secretion system protein [Pseudomonas sp. LRF_L74]|uniref:type III secretion system protein n=1 Tax=Pseudomonas sp. LRF_L74 TaxID=3369422 RepID=UPI003F62D1E2
MNAVPRRHLSAEYAQASRALGAGVAMPFTAHGRDGELRLTPLPAATSVADGVWLGSAIGAFCLSDADAILSLLGELPVSTAGAHQDWYWPVVSQRLAGVIADSLSPLAPLAEEPPTAQPMRCRIEVTLGDEGVHGQLSTSAETLLAWLQAPMWRAIRRPSPESLRLCTPWVLGELQLTLEQLASLRPGDVVLPTTMHVDSLGTGQLALAGSHWSIQARPEDARLFLTLTGQGNDSQ